MKNIKWHIIFPLSPCIASIYTYIHTYTSLYHPCITNTHTCTHIYTHMHTYVEGPFLIRSAFWMRRATETLVTQVVSASGHFSCGICALCPRTSWMLRKSHYNPLRTCGMGIPTSLLSFGILCGCCVVRPHSSRLRNGIDCRPLTLLRSFPSVL